MKIMCLTLLLVTACAGARGQVVPAATGPGGPPIRGNLSYSLRYAQTAFLYGDNQVEQGNQVFSIASVDLNYARPSSRYPFSLKYGGGYMWSIAGPSLGTGFFQRLLVSQSYVQRRWSLTGSDGVSYTPQAPTTGFSGIPGTGEPIGGSGTSAPTSQSILTLNTRALTNAANLDLGYTIDSATTLSVGGGWQILRYPDGNGLESDGEDAKAGITRRLNARNSISGLYSFSHFSYGASPYSDGVAGDFASNLVTVEYQRAWSRHLSVDVAVGPQWTGGSDQALVPATTTIAVNAGLDFQARSEAASVRYSRGINGDTGYLPGAVVDSVVGGFSRTFARNLTLGAMGAYLRTSALASAGGSTDAVFGGVQVWRRLGPYLNVFGSYTAIDQSSGLTGAQSNVLNQLYHVISFGIAYSPREKRVRQ